MTIANASTILASDLNALWPLVTAIQDDSQDLYEETPIVFRFDGALNSWTTSNPVNPLSQKIWVPSVDSHLVEVRMYVSDATTNATISFTVEGNINQTISLYGDNVAGSESEYVYGNTLINGVPDGLITFLAGDTVTVSITGAGASAVSRVAIHLIVKSKLTSR